MKKISSTETTVFVYDGIGRMIAEYSTDLAETQQVSYLTTDHLGSPRINTNENGAVVSRTDYMPYGEEIIGLGGRSTTDKYVGDDVHQGFTGYINDEETNLGDTIRKQFTGYERDGETELDFAQARYFGSSSGRFTSPDPTLLSANGFNPQTWNRYSYVMGNPLIYVDPFGLWALAFEPEYKKKGDSYDTHHVMRIKIYFVKTSDDDNADSLLAQLGFHPTDSGYDEMRAQIALAIENMTTSEFGTTGILASDLSGSVGGVDIGGVYRIMESLLGEQGNYNADNPGTWNDSRRGPVNDAYRDCTETTARLSLGIGPTDSLESLHAGDGPSGFDERFLPNLDVAQTNSLRLLDVVRYDGSGKPNKRHYMTVIFTGVAGTTWAFTRSGLNGQFNIVPAESFNGSDYGKVGGRRKKETGYYGRRPKPKKKN